jgi:hypothetical protein
VTAVQTSDTRQTVHFTDGKLLVALVSPSHVQHTAAERWFAGGEAPFATCPVTQ